MVNKAVYEKGIKKLLYVLNPVMSFSKCEHPPRRIITFSLSSLAPKDV